MKSTFSVIYYLKRQVVKKDGTVPVMGRITVDGSQTQFSCKLTIDPKLWDTKGGRVTGRSTAALETNRMLDKMRVRINKHYQEIMERDNFVTAEKVKNAFLGLPNTQRTVRMIKLHIASPMYCATCLKSAVAVISLLFLIFLFLMRIQELRELSFKLSYLPLVYPTFFLMRLSVASVVFVSGA